MAYELGLTQIAQQAGIPVFLLLLVVLWTAFWKLFGLWKSARNGHTVWFIVIALVNTVGILPIVYIFGISRYIENTEEQARKDSKKKSRSKKDSNKK